MKSKCYAFNRNSPLSNHYPMGLSYFAWGEDRWFKTAEHAIMFIKAARFDPSKLSLILDAETPLEAKRIGRTIENFNYEQWKRDCDREVPRILYYKMRDNAEIFHPIMLEVKRGKIVEASPRDRIWGTGYGLKRSANGESRGENRLGEYWTKVINTAYAQFKHPFFSTDDDREDVGHTFGECPVCYQGKLMYQDERIKCDSCGTYQSS